MSFIKFGELPVEIRIQIWQLAIEELGVQVVRLPLNHDIPPLSLALVNREARYEMLQKSFLVTLDNEQFRLLKNVYWWIRMPEGAVKRFFEERFWTMVVRRVALLEHRRTLMMSKSLWDYLSTHELRSIVELFASAEEVMVMVQDDNTLAFGCTPVCGLKQIVPPETNWSDWEKECSERLQSKIKTHFPSNDTLPQVRAKTFIVDSYNVLALENIRKYRAA